MVLTSPKGFVAKQAVKFKFPVTNNEAEYEGLIAGLKLALKLEAGVIDIFSDSQLVVKQVLGEFKAINDRMSTYMQLTLKLLQKFTSWTISNIGRSTNQWEDTLSKMATSNIHQVTDPTYFTELSHPSIEVREVNCISNEEDWRTPIIKFIQGNITKSNRQQLRKIEMKAKLFRRALVEPLLRCVNKDESQIVIEEIYSGICGDHLAGKNVALKIIRHGIFWPTICQDCEKYMKQCKPCQLYSSKNHKPSVPFNPTTSPCPFYMWGIDLVGLLPKSSKQYNGTQFTGESWKIALEELEVQHLKASVAYPQANGQVEITNKAFLQGLKKRLMDANRNWVDELPDVL
ncbi:uncharacterized protein LOC141703798 [Apium graveolens]|uniref:uncharacterized protein LOC141703798 n=1 Tax=Apium graveolens TaxID=4045 RepID=UPI003D7AA4FB